MNRLVLNGALESAPGFQPGKLATIPILPFYPPLGIKTSFGLSAWWVYATISTPVSAGAGYCPAASAGRLIEK